MKDITLGRYVPYNTFIHRLDARTKIISMILIMVAIFFSYSTYGVTFLVGGILGIIIFVLAIISHTSLRSLFSSLKAMWFIVLFLMIINCLIPPSDAKTVLFSIGNLDIYLESIYQSLKIVIRLVLMIAITMILTTTTKPLDLTFALEWFFAPLKLIKFPVHAVAMTITIALRFIPTLLLETERIMKAQSSRGVDFKRGKFSSKVKAIVSLIIPLFVSSFQRSEELADSMEARGYDPNATRTRYHVSKFNKFDLVSFIFSLVILGSVIAVKTTNISAITPYFWIYILSGVTLIELYFTFICALSLKGKK